ncbi:MAG: hypothetical protein D3922_12190 [Candidatus Electrothrix sp. AR1]|nr:hypothetical protein [Candidatus Electrothrix sp. AR1]
MFLRGIPGDRSEAAQKRLHYTFFSRKILVRSSSYNDVHSARKERTISMAGNGSKKAGFDNALIQGQVHFLSGTTV